MCEGGSKTGLAVNFEDITRGKCPAGQERV